MIPATSLVRFCLAIGVSLVIGTYLPSVASAAVIERDAVAGFLKKHCSDCHTADAKEGSVSLDPLLVSGAVGESSDLWLRVFEQLALGRMPPESEPQPIEAERTAVTGWMEAELRRAGKESDVRHKLLYPEYGNYVSHKRLFDGSQKGPASSPPRLWRIRPDVYDRIIDGLNPQLRFAATIDQPFTLDDEKGVIADYSAANFADGSTLQRLIMNCEAIAVLETTGLERRQWDNAQKKEKINLVRNTQKEYEAVLSAPGLPSVAQMEAAVRKEFIRVLGRDPDAEETKRFVDFMARACTEAGNAKGLATTLTAIMLQPEAVFRMEIGLGKPDVHGRRMLSPYELAYAVSYALTDRGPAAVLLGPMRPNSRTKTGPTLLEAAASGQLSKRADVERVVRQMLNDADIEKPRLLGFFHQFFGYQQAPAVFKGSRIGREYAPQIIVKDADDLVLRILKDDRDVFRRLLSTDEFCVAAMPSAEEYHKTMKRMIDGEKNPTSPNAKYFAFCKENGINPIPQGNHDWRRYVRFYNLDERTWNYPIEQPFAMPAGQRAGLLTHPAWLIAWSGNFDNDVVRRGKWIREHLLADVVPEVPITVNAAVPEDEHKTLRERMAVTREEYCWKCHRKMDPLGLPFEIFDDFGRYRTEQQSADKKKHPIDATGEIFAGVEPSLAGDVHDALELMGKLADSPRVRQSIVRHTFRHWMGRNETLADSPTLMAADRAYVESGGSFRALIVSLLTSDSFLYRK